MESDSPLESHPPKITTINSLNLKILQCSKNKITRMRIHKGNMYNGAHSPSPYPQLQITKRLFTMSLPSVQPASA